MLLKLKGEVSKYDIAKFLSDYHPGNLEYFLYIMSMLVSEKPVEFDKTKLKTEFRYPMDNRCGIPANWLEEL